MKILKTNAQVARSFAEQQFSGAMNATSSLYYRKNTIFSYGKHFPIAVFLESNLVLFNNIFYSPTTAKHQSLVLRALRENRKHINIVDVPLKILDLVQRPGGYSWELFRKILIDDFKEEFDFLLKRAKRRRKIEYKKQDLENLLQRAHEVDVLLFKHSFKLSRYYYNAVEAELKRV